jgi:uncharacterized membrane protein YdbT with pleckstrin-like domain
MKIDKSQIKTLEVIWEDRKRTLFGLPISFTKYTLNEEELAIKTGFLNINKDEVKLYRILDISERRTLGQRIFGIGTLHICSSDKSLGEFDIRNIKQVDAVKQLLSQNVEKQRELKRVSSREFMTDGHEDFDDQEDINDH